MYKQGIDHWFTRVILKHNAEQLTPSSLVVSIANPNLIGIWIIRVRSSTVEVHRLESMFYNGQVAYLIVTLIFVPSTS
jgi:hypothetical protein